MLRLLHGEGRDTVSRELGVTSARPSSWRVAFLAGGTTQLKSRPEEGHAKDVRRRKAQTGELAIANEALEEKIVIRVARIGGRILRHLRISESVELEVTIPRINVAVVIGPLGAIDDVCIAHREHPDRGIVNTRIGHRDR